MSGKGAYYKNKYGGGGRGRGGGGGGNGGGKGGGYKQWDDRGSSQSFGRDNGSSRDLGNILRRIDGKSYPAYKDILGVWKYDDFFTLYVDHVQGDAYASPSNFRVQISHERTGIPADLWRDRGRSAEIALRDFFCRSFCEQVRKAGGDIRKGDGKGWHSAKGGEMTVDTPGQTILDRTAVVLTPDALEARFTIALPASGRTVLGQMAYRCLIDMLPQYVQQGLLYESVDAVALERHINCVEDADYLRGQLNNMGLVAFVENGSILPRTSGAADTPMLIASKQPKSSTDRSSIDGAIPFMSPSTMAVEVELPHRGVVCGMGIVKGVTLIVGGGFHGKSTLLKAVEAGVYNHIPGDGRELVVTDATAVKIRAEDGRYISHVNISPFIDNLPYDKPTDAFSSRDASGSTSQASNIQEALEIGCTAMLIDEDTCATNFMIRDERMQSLISPDKEPITPFISKVRSIYSSLGTSSVLVIGGCGEYFDVADQVIMMDAFVPHDVTERAKAISAKFSDKASLMEFSSIASSNVFPSPTCRVVSSILPSRHDVKISVRNRFLIQVGDIDLNLNCVEQISDSSQTRAIADILQYLNKAIANDGLTVSNLLRHLDEAFDGPSGLDVLFRGGRIRGNLARPRKFEIAAAINRLRSAHFHHK